MALTRFVTRGSSYQAISCARRHHPHWMKWQLQVTVDYLRSGEPCPIEGCGRLGAQERWSFAVERAHLDGVVPGDRMRGRELDRLLPVSAADDVDAGDELLGLDERAVADRHLPVADADRGGRIRALERVPQHLQAARLQVLSP